MQAALSKAILDHERVRLVLERFRANANKQRQLMQAPLVE